MNWTLVISVSVLVTVVMSAIIYFFDALTFGSIVAFAVSALLSSMLTNFATKPKAPKLDS